MAHKRIASYLRTHRKKSNLTQREIAQVLGYTHEGPVSRHERGVTVPPLPIALAYEALFRVPIYELFPGVYEAAGEHIEAQLAGFESRLGEKSAKDRDAAATARKLEFLWGRKNGVEI
jgi:transcriptional regulator with XRE-family HTH domain